MEPSEMPLQDPLLSAAGNIGSENEVRIVAKSGMLDGISRFIGYGLAFVVNILLARLTGSAAIGSVSVALSAVNTMQLLPGMGLSLAILRKMPMFIGLGDKRNAARVVLSSYAFVFSAACILVLAYFGLIRRLAYALIVRSTGSVAVFDVFVAIFPFICMLPLLQSTFTALQQTYKSTQYDQIVRNLFRLLATAAAILFLSKIGSLLFGTVISIIASFCIQLWILLAVLKLYLRAPAIQFPILPAIGMANILKYGFPLMIVPLLNAASRELDLWIVGYYLNPKQAGIYAIIRILGGTLLIPLLMFGEIFGVSIAKLLVSADHGGVRRLNAISAKWIGLLSGFCFVIITCFSRDILALFGKDYLDGGAALRIFAVGQLIFGFFGATGTLLLMFDKRAFLIANGIISLLINLALSIALTPRFGILGAATAMALTFSMTSILVLTETVLFLKVPPGSFLTYMKRISVIVASYFCMQYVSSLFSDLHYALRLIFGIAIALIFMTALFAITEKWDLSERHILTTLFKRLVPSHQPKPA
jgi:O-antigen/teichoic acid export membrane protein